MPVTRESYAVQIPDDAIVSLENAVGLALLSTAGNVVTLELHALPDPKLGKPKQERLRWAVQPPKIHGPERS